MGVRKYRRIVKNLQRGNKTYAIPSCFTNKSSSETDTRWVALLDGVWPWSSTPEDDAARWLSKSIQLFPFFFIHLGRFASAPKSTWPIKQHKHLFGATPAAEGPPERQRRDAGGELNLATCCAHLSEFCQCHLLTLLRIQRKNEEWSCCWRLCYYYCLFSCLVLLTSALISDPATCPPHRLPPLHTCSSIQYSQVSIILYVSFLAPALSLIFPASVLRVRDCVLRHTYPPRSPRFCLAAFQVMTVQVAGSNSMLIANQKFWKTHFIVTERCLVDAEQFTTRVQMIYLNSA